MAGKRRKQQQLTNVLPVIEENGLMHSSPLNLRHYGSYIHNCLQ